MIISDKYKYVFLETPRTGSTAIAQELCELYDGQKIVRKHANYYDLLKYATEAQKKYFIFSGVRNPLDSVVSKFTKLKNNHRGRYTDPAYLKKNGGWITQGDIERFLFVQQHDFGDFIKKFYKTPFLNTLSVHHAACSYIIRFENLNKDFIDVLEKLSINPVRLLPVVNKTAKSPIMFHNCISISEQAKTVNSFGPYMKEFGYDFPSDWQIREPTKLSSLLYNAKVILAKAYCVINPSTGTVKKSYVCSK